MVKASGVMHADETGWRINGQTHWLWAFSTQYATYDMIDKSRASPVVLRKNSDCNRSVDGAKTQAILMSVFQTLKNNANVTKTIVNALHHFLKTKKLPSLAQAIKNSAE